MRNIIFLNYMMSHEYMTPDDTNDENDISLFQYVDFSCDYYTPDQFGIMTNSLQPHNSR